MCAFGPAPASTISASARARLSLVADQEGGQLGRPRHRRRQANRREVGRQRAQPREIEREEIAALGRGQRMQLVDDDHAKRAEQARSIAMRQHQRDLLRRGQQDIGRHETLALAAGGVACRRYGSRA